MKYSKLFGFIFMLGGLVIFNSIAYAKKQQTYVDRDTGSSQIQGLKYVKASAHTLMASYNKQHQTKWQALEPNAKYVLDRCLVPLKSSWGIYDIVLPTGEYRKNLTWHIVVKCDKTVVIGGKHSTWKAIVPTTRPYIQPKGKLLSHK